MITRLITLACALLFAASVFAQTAKVVGYVYETNNGGYLNEVEVKIEGTDGTVFPTVFSDKEGKFEVTLPTGIDYRLRLRKAVFEDQTHEFSLKGKSSGEKVFQKIAMERKPGYLLEATISELLEIDPDAEIDPDEIVVDAISGIKVEVYNNTTKKQELTIESTEAHTFSHQLEQGNQYTIMLRKKGYFTKRIEANVHVDGCILCIEGIGKINPGVAESLTEGNSRGVLAANIDLRKIEVNKGFEVENIYYDYNKDNIRFDAAIELDKLIGLLKDNPTVIVELGSHTDARGKKEYNYDLSSRRAKSAVDYIVEGGIPQHRISARGYGETTIINKCKEGVECDDKEHEENRRTEIKVTGFLRDDSFSKMSLEDIILRENFEQEYEKIGTEEEEETEIYIAPPRDLDAPETPEMPTEDLPEEETEIYIAPPVNEVEAAADAVRDAVIEVQPEIETPSVPEGMVGEPQNLPTETLEVEAAVNRTARPVPSDYTGFKIQFASTEERLDASDPVFSQFGKVNEEEIDGRWCYLIGKFKTAKNAQNFLNSIIVARYPTARVVEYVDGKRQ